MGTMSPPDSNSSSGGGSSGRGDGKGSEPTAAPAPQAAPASPPSTRPNRSVLDFDTRRALREALENCSRRGSVCSQWDLETEGDVDSAADAAAVVPDKGDWVTQNLDALMSLPQKVDTEIDRLLVLRSYLLLDNDPEPSFERITALASRFFDVPIALVSLVDLGRQWFMSNRGLPSDVRETPRSMAFCAHAVQSVSDMLIINSAKDDPRFKNNPLVTGAPHIRFYAGAPLICPEGHRLGTLCIIDTKSRPSGLSLGEKQTLKELSAMVVETMVRRRDDRRRLADGASRAVACAAHDVMAPLEGARHALNKFVEKSEELDEEGDGLELVRSAETCLNAMDRICTETVQAFKEHLEDTGRRNNPNYHEGGGGVGSIKKETVLSTTAEETKEAAEAVGDGGEGRGHGPADKCHAADSGIVVLPDLVRQLETMAETFPFRDPAVSLTIEIDDVVPHMIVSDELKIFRSAMNYIANALQSTQGKDGSVRMRVYIQEPEEVEKRPGQDEQKSSCSGTSDSLPPLPPPVALVFECEDTGTGVNEATISKGLFEPFRVGGRVSSAMGGSSLGLGLFSVANSISSLGGRYGYHPRKTDDEDGDGDWDEKMTDESPPGAVFWFSVPLIVPYSAKSFDKSEGEEDVASAPEAAATPAPEKGKENRSPTSPGGSASPSAGGGSADAGSGQKLKVLSLAPSGDYDSEKVFDAVSKVMEGGEEKSGGGAALEPPPARGPSAASAPGGGGGSAIASKRALVIDDSIVTRESVGRALINMGFSVDVATDGMEGLQRLQSTRYDVVFCDFLLPVMDGIDCVKRYRSWEATHRPSFRQRIIGLSEHDSAEDVKQGTDAGMDEFMSKARKRREILDRAISIARRTNEDGSGGERGSNSDAAAPSTSARSRGGTGTLGSVLSMDMPVSRLGTHGDFSSLLRGSKPTPSSIHLGFPTRHPPNVAPIKLSAALSAPSVSHALASAAAIGNERNRGVGRARGGGGGRSRPTAAEIAVSAAARDAVGLGGGSRQADHCLIVVDSRSALKALRRIAVSKGWTVKAGEDGEDGTRLLKAQMWGAVLIGDDIEGPDGPACVAQFREWELKNRSSRQLNIFLVRGKESAPNGNKSHGAPTGFDGVLSKPIRREDAEIMLERARLQQSDKEEVM